MFKVNTITRGVIIGLILPAITVFIFLYILKGEFLILNKPGIPYLVAVFLNLLIMRYCARKGMDKIAIGIMAISFLFLIAVFVFKLQPIR
jgi:hypothetical protein